VPSIDNAKVHPAGRPDRRRSLGRRGEDVAANYLTGCGWQIIARNWRCRYGEIDMIARGEGSRDPIIFCEVKTRAGLGYGAPLEAITTAKMRRLRQLAGCWLAETGQHALHVRVDAIGVLVLPGRDPQITHVEGAGG
jgi:putative endonuclease